MISGVGDLELNNQTATISYMIESIYYDYDLNSRSESSDNSDGSRDTNFNIIKNDKQHSNVEIVANTDDDSSKIKSNDVLRINNEKSLNKEIIIRNENQPSPSLSSSFPSKSLPDIYPDPDKIYSRLKEMREDVIFQLKEQKHNGEEVESFSSDFSEENFNKDLKGHDLIDNIMYIYYGANNVMRKGLGRNIIVIGAVFGLAAQILAISLSFLRNK